MDSANKDITSAIVTDDICIMVAKSLDLTSDSLGVIEEKKKNYTSSSTTRVYNGNYYNPNYNQASDLRSVYFYEFSNLDNKPLIFSKVSDFVAWCEKNTVLLSTYMIEQLRINPVSYCVCKEGCSNVIRASTKTYLEELLHPKEYNTVHSVGCGRYPYDYVYYDEWD